MLTLVSKDSVKISDHFDVLCVLIACTVLEIINQMSKNQKSSLIVWNTVEDCDAWWFSDGCSSLVASGRSQEPYRFSSVGVTARFEFHLVAFNELHSVRESWVHGRSRTCRVYGCLKTSFNQGLKYLFLTLPDSE